MRLTRSFRYRPHLSFRAKTILGVALIEAVLLAVLVIANLSALRASTEDELTRRAQTTAKLFADLAASGVLSNDLASLQSFVERVMRNPGIVYARVRGNGGTVLVEGGDTAKAVALHVGSDAGSFARSANAGLVNVAADVTIQGQPQGEVEIGVSTAGVQQALASARRHAISIALIEMTLVAVFSYALGLYLTRRLTSIKSAAERVASGELGFTIPVSGHDELDDTARSFNAMSVKLQIADRERRNAEDALNKLNADLERRVTLRTEQLAEANRELEHQALHDALTRLPNRSLFYDRLRQATLSGKREGRVLALMIMDLDGFKQVNDNYGHHAGDLLLQETGSRLRETLRESDTVARLGGDEFALLLPTIKDAAAATFTAEKILTVLAEPYFHDQERLAIGASIGIALFPQDGDSEQELMRRADAAMYTAKRMHLGFALYEPNMETQPGYKDDRHVIQRELRHAIAANQLVLHYQPKVQTEGGAVLGLEALVRWQHPVRGLLFPQDFLPIVEKAGLMPALTDWVLNRAISDCGDWQKQGIDLGVSVNVSLYNLIDPEFPHQVARALTKSMLWPAKLELELSETTIMAEPNRAIDVITKLSELGAQIVIDDFGIGYSSMAYLKKLPIAKIKIDRSFVSNMQADANQATIVRSIIGLGQNLGFSVIAEGVENQQSWDQLKKWGCDAIQGYCLSRPMNPQDLEAWLARWREARGTIDKT